MMSTLYDKLGCTADDSFEVLKKAYHELILMYHPDKSNDQNNCRKFHEINTAWNILRDPISRKKYDTVLFQAVIDSQKLIYDTIELKNIHFDEESKCYYYPCRCGVDFSFYKSDSLDRVNNFVVDCDNCSLCLFILNNHLEKT